MPADIVTRLHDSHEQITILISRLEQADAECAVAASGLERISEMNLQQRRELADRIRAASKERDAVTQRIDEVLAGVASVGNHESHGKST